MNKERIMGEISPFNYGHFIEHFHRQIYGGIYNPQNVLADKEGFRTDVIEAMKKIKVSILRWPGGCFVSSYHWKDAVGSKRTPLFDKAWRVEEPNTFGTDEYIQMCRKIGCEPYICTNAGTGTAEEMSDWVEYCNLENEGQYAKRRINNGYKEPHNVKYWSIGNENYGWWEIGAKSAEEWGRIVLESAKMIKHVSPTTELTAAALSDLDWNINLLKHSGKFLDWISIHKYWDELQNVNNIATYEESMAYTANIDKEISEVRGLLIAMGLEKKIKIAFDEWNLRGWYHPNVHTIKQGIDKVDYIEPRNENDDNSIYTMTDAVFTACVLNMLNRNCDIVGMANFAPVVNTRGCIYTHDNGIVLRSTYHIFDLYVNYLGNEMIDSFSSENVHSKFANKEGRKVEVDTLDIIATYKADENLTALAIVNKAIEESITLEVNITGFDAKEFRVITVNGDSTESYNDVDHTEVYLREGAWSKLGKASFEIAAHSVNVIQFK
ncbi:MAG: alpha-L-arabinofuranosidase C-terminal domain-containing protein [Suipraeoptans sp.]